VETIYLARPRSSAARVLFRSSGAVSTGASPGIGTRIRQRRSVLDPLFRRLPAPGHLARLDSSRAASPNTSAFGVARICLAATEDQFRLSACICSRPEQVSYPIRARCSTR